MYVVGNYCIVHSRLNEPGTDLGLIPSTGAFLKPQTGLFNPFTDKYLNVYVVPSAGYFNNHDPMFNILVGIFFNELMWQDIHFWKANVLIFHWLSTIIAHSSEKVNK